MIGIFDSGVGGLGICKEVKKLMSGESIIYLADTVNCPYGGKSDSQIKKIALENTKFLINEGCNIIMIACNTASTIALEYVRRKLDQLPPSGCKLVQVVGVVPVVKTASEISRNKRIGILATKKTVESKYLHNLVDQFCPPYAKASGGKPHEKGFKVYYQEAAPLVSLVENFQFPISNFQINSNFQNSKPETGCHSELGSESHSSKLRFRNKFGMTDTERKRLIIKYLQLFIKNKVDTIALGCTHFPFLRKEIQEIMGPKVEILDSNGAVARQVGRIANSISHMAYGKSQIAYRKNKNNKPYAISNKPKYQFFTTGDKNKLKLVVESYLKIKNPRVYQIS